MKEDKEIEPVPTADLEKKEIEKLSTEVIAVCEKFKYEIMRCVNCSIVLECKYPAKRLDVLKVEAEKMSTDVYEEEVELDQSAENVLRAQQRRDQVYQQFIKDRAIDVLKNDRCIFERKEILNSLQKFVNAGYDIIDPRTSLIINELIGNILNSGRANKCFTSLGILLRKDTPAGPIYYQNPLLTVKMQFSKLIIEATEALDRIIKSDNSQKAEASFTAHLLDKLQISEQKKSKLIDEISKGD